jgi:hypothetical protein
MVFSDGYLGRNPAIAAAYWIRARLNAPGRTPVRVLDAAGNLVATIDGETRKRTEVRPGNA